MHIAHYVHFNGRYYVVGISRVRRTVFMISGCKSRIDSIRNYDRSM